MYTNHARSIFEINVLHNWSKFADFLIPVMFTNDMGSKFADLARSLGWTVYPIESTNSYGYSQIDELYIEST